MCQNNEPEDSDDIELLKVAREIMMSSPTCVLISLDEDGLPAARMMDPFIPENDFTVWFGTNPGSRKVEQIRSNPGVTLYYPDSDGSGYVVIHGEAQLVDDQKEKEKRFKIEWEAFYPDRQTGYILIKVKPVKMEVLSYSNGIVGDPVTWRVPVVQFDIKK